MNKVHVMTALMLLAIAHLEAAKPKSAKKEKVTSGKIFNKNIYDLAHENTYFRKELVTGEHSQVVIMSIPVGGEIGMERHHVDQTLVFVEGEGQAIINDEISDVSEDHLVFVPAGAEHNFKNTGDTELKLFTIYAPPQHKPGTVEKVKGKSY
ncbi:MAG TPA: cupin domain-containing protein, partial [Candidatus Babeliales bacterium]|nr:cupin domain-containing protein [Candidatus Babeliales bacterium]